MAFEIAKAGWMFRLSSILHRWKRSWFVLYIDGTLRFFDSPDSHTAEEAYSIPANCIRVLTGDFVANVTPPDGGYSRSSLLKVEFRDNSSLTMCAESPDDMRAWQMALEQARVAALAMTSSGAATVTRPATAPPPYSANVQTYTVPPYSGGVATAYTATPAPYYQYQQPGATVYYTQPGQTVYTTSQLGPGYVVPQGGNTTIIVRDDPYYNRGGYYGGDFAMGALTGAAVGSMMMAPLWWGGGWC